MASSHPRACRCDSCYPARRLRKRSWWWFIHRASEAESGYRWEPVLDARPRFVTVIRLPGDVEHVVIKGSVSV